MTYVINHVITEGEGLTRRVEAHFGTLAQAVNWVRTNVIADLVSWYSRYVQEARIGREVQTDVQAEIDRKSLHAALEWIEEV